MITNITLQNYAVALTELYLSYKRRKTTGIGVARARGIATELLSGSRDNLTATAGVIAEFVASGQVHSLQSTNPDKSGVGGTSLRGMFIKSFVLPQTQAAYVKELLAQKGKEYVYAKAYKHIFTDNLSQRVGNDDELFQQKTQFIQLITQYLDANNHTGLTRHGSHGRDRAMDLANAGMMAKTSNELRVTIANFLKEGKTATDEGILNLFGLWNKASNSTNEDSLRAILLKHYITDDNKRNMIISQGKNMMISSFAEHINMRPLSAEKRQDPQYRVV